MQTHYTRTQANRKKATTHGMREEGFDLVFFSGIEEFSLTYNRQYLVFYTDF